MRTPSAAKIGLLVIGGIATVALLQVGAPALAVAGTAIGAIAGWMAKEAESRLVPPAAAPPPASPPAP